MPGRGERRERYRGILLVSLILLVSNSIATCIFLFFPPSTVDPASPDPGIAILGAPSAAGSATLAPPSAHSLSVKQAFLIGKRIDINRAPWREISTLPGISDAVAKRVVETRGRLGAFRSPEALLSVPGIKERRLKKILPFLANFGNK